MPREVILNSFDRRQLFYPLNLMLHGKFQTLNLMNFFTCNISLAWWIKFLTQFCTFVLCLRAHKFCDLKPIASELQILGSFYRILDSCFCRIKFIFEIRICENILFRFDSRFEIHKNLKIKILIRDSFCYQICF